jgi:hypothetical protein
VIKVEYNVSIFQEFGVLKEQVEHPYQEQKLNTKVLIYG